jgi:dolichol-phosphate mannosyltransferase
MTNFFDTQPISFWADACFFLVLLVQVPAFAVVVSRLSRGPGRRQPLQPQRSEPKRLGTVSIIIPTLNEASRIIPCLEGLTRQGYEVREMIVVDSHSQDGTVELVKAAQKNDPRFRLLTDDPLPSGWVGRPWALHSGFQASSEQSEWILGIDADTQPQPELAASLVASALAEGYDLVSLSPQFVLKDLGEFWLQPALLMTLIYRFGAAGDRHNASERIMANGQCFLCRRSLLVDLGGYASARNSFCDDVTLARYAAAHGAKVGFWDGTKLLKVRMYEGAAETWREWGRSLDLKDAATPQQTWGDLGLLIAVQGLPLPLLLVLASQIGSKPFSATWGVALGLNALLVMMRIGMTVAIAPSYDFSQAKPGATVAFWLSPLADPLAVIRIFLSSIRTPTQWRGRHYAAH